MKKEKQRSRISLLLAKKELNRKKKKWLLFFHKEFIDIPFFNFIDYLFKKI
jgi:hypothetical protein